ncbi:MAG: bis(5'-nucleosyl)-tetraphosphatase (symmetrical) YqeK [Clostridioides difficile]|nr:bis(5'-nucleosyl)-tetraphosphatase (symmetrical) YqeK [Clostridioides sp.]MBS5787592.1 bis(5'-nucleosyl)-tetraphosphatase (symmetrical) YqeK [Clostridioides difficile]
MNIEEINQKLCKLLPKGRINHSYRVADCAVKLSKIYNCDEEKAYLAGIVHDAAKCLKDNQVKDYVDKYEIYLDPIEENNLALSHSVIGSYIAEYEFNIDDKDIINAVRYHTTGRENMALLEKIIYIADLIEDGRTLPHVQTLRELAFKGKLDEALLISFNNTLNFVINNNNLIHPRTVTARNYMIKEMIL